MWYNSPDLRNCLLGLLDRIVSPVRNLFAKPTNEISTGYKTFTEYSPNFTSWDGTLYEQALTRSIVECIATHCSKLKPEFVTPDGSGGSLPRIQRLIASWPNDMMTWPTFLKRCATLYYVETTLFVVPEYDARDQGTIVGIWPLKPSYTELIEYEGEPWLRFHLATGETQAYPFYDVVILTRFQLDSDVFGGGNLPLTSTLRLMEAQRQAEEVALKTGADIRFIGRVGQIMHGNDLSEKRKQFAEDNLDPRKNTYGLMLYDGSIQDLQQVKNQSYTVDPTEMERINKACYAYFGINEDILQNKYDDRTWASFYEGPIESFALAIGEGMSARYLTRTQRIKGNRIMFSSNYLEYASTDSKIKVANLLTTTGTGTKNEVRDIFQLPRLANGDVFMVRGEIYITDEDNNIIAESGGHGDGSWHDDLSDLDEPEPDEVDDLTRAFGEKVAEIVRRRLEGVEI